MIDYTVDLLIFGISSKENSNIRELSKKNLSVILVKRDKEPFKDKLCLPGGYVNKNENSEEAAKRVLEKETGLNNIELYLSNVNDDVKRDPRNRTVSVSYIALVDIEKINNKLKEGSAWYDIDYVIKNKNIDIKLTNNSDIVFSVGREIIDKKSKYERYYQINPYKLGFDHDIILTKGIMDLRNKVQNTDIVFNLLPENFTVGALEQIYGNILKEKVVNSAFRRTFADKLQVTKNKVKTGGHRPSYLYQYKYKKDEPTKKEEMVDVYDPDTLKRTGDVISKNSAHKLGIWHSSIHLLIINKDKTKVLFQQRTSTKDLWPNLWDISVGGHISAGENAKDSVMRELNEELGIGSSKYEIKQLKVFKEEMNYENYNNKEVIYLFILYADIDTKDLKLQKEEVKDVKWITKEEMNNLIDDKKAINHVEERNILNEILK